MPASKIGLATRAFVAVLLALARRYELRLRFVQSCGLFAGSSSSDLLWSAAGAKNKVSHVMLHAMLSAACLVHCLHACVPRRVGALISDGSQRRNVSKKRSEATPPNYAKA